MKFLYYCLLVLLPVSLRAAAAPPPDLVFAAESDWEVVTTGHGFAEGMAWDRDGHYYFTDVRGRKLYKVDRTTGEQTLIDGATGGANGLEFGPDGRLYGCGSGDRCIYAWDPKTWQKVKVAEGTQSNDIVILRDGTIFYTEPGTRKVWRLAANTFARDQGIDLGWGPNGIAVSLDEKTLLVAEFNSDTVHGFALDANSKVVGPDRPAYKLSVPSNGVGGLDGMIVLRDGRLLIGTSAGTQIAHPLGTPGKNIVIPIPGNRPRNNYVRISPDRVWIYCAYRDDILRRKLKPDFDQP